MRTARNAPGVCLGLVLSMHILSGCEPAGMDELRSYIREIKSRPPGPMAPLPEIQPVAPFIFDPAGRRDPFAMDQPRMGPAISDNRLAPDPNRPKEQLEAYPLADLVMVGTLQQDNTFWALIKSKDGILFRARVGSYMGLNNGQVVDIRNDSIRIMEIVSDSPGEWRESPITIRLRES
jgi:type IV pilus assembly protein PilP